jgi:hypothetical protein
VRLALRPQPRRAASSKARAAASSSLNRPRWWYFPLYMKEQCHRPCCLFQLAPQKFETKTSCGDQSTRTRRANGTWVRLRAQHRRAHRHRTGAAAHEERRRERGSGNLLRLQNVYILGAASNVYPWRVTRSSSRSPQAVIQVIDRVCLEQNGLRFVRFRRRSATQKMRSERPTRFEGLLIQHAADRRWGG